MKKKILNFWLLALMVMLGGMNAWAETGDTKTNADIDFSNAIVDGIVAGTVNQMTIGTGGAETAITSEGFLRLGDHSNVVTIPELERAGNRDVVTVSFDMAWGNKNGMGSGFSLKDAEDQALAFFRYARWDGKSTNSNTLGVDMEGLIATHYKNAPISGRATHFAITIDYATKLITTVVTCPNPSATKTFTASMSNTNPIASFEVFGYGADSNADRASLFDNLKITTTEGNYAVETATYTVNFVCDGIVFKTEERTGVVGDNIVLTGDDTSNTTVENIKYIYISNDAEGKAVASDGSTIITISYRKAAEWTYSVKAVADELELGTLLTGTVAEGDAVNYGYPQYYAVNGDLYQSTKQGSNPWWGKTFTPEADNATQTIAYTKTDLSNIVFCKEAEDIETLTKITGGNTDIRASNRAGAYAAEDAIITTLPAGKYILYAALYGNSGTTYTFMAGETTVLELTTSGNPMHTASEEFELSAATDIIVPKAGNGGNSPKIIDYIIIQKTSDVEAPVSDDVLPLTLTFPDYNDASIGSYTAEWTATVDGKIWTLNGFNNNSNKWSLVKCGRKNNEQTATITSPVVNAEVKNVVYTLSKADNIASVTLTILNGEETVETIDITEKFVVGDVNVPVNGAKGYSYKLTVNSTAASANGTTEITKVALYGEGQYVVVEPVHIANTAETAYTVAEAIALIDAGEALSETVFVKGIISKVEKYNENYKSINYWISEDGTEEAAQFECYSGKGLEGADFESIDDVKVGASVIVTGTMKKYGETYEFNQGNKLVSYDYTEPKNYVAQWDFTKSITTAEEFLADATNWTSDNNDTRFTYSPKTDKAALMLNGEELADTKGLLFTGGAGKFRIDINQRLGMNGGSLVLTIPNLKKGQIVTVDAQSANSTAERGFKPTNLTYDAETQFLTVIERQVNVATVTEDGNVTLTTTGGMNVYAITVEEAQVVEPEIVPGDVSGDGEVTVSDAVVVIDFVLGAQEPTEAQKKAADVNKDNEITVSDVSGIVSIALGLWDGTIAEASRGMANDDYVVLNGTEVGLVNANQYVGFQMDVTLADGAQLNGVSRTARTLGYQVAWNRVGRNTYRIVAFSMGNETLSQNEGALLSLDVTGNQQLTLSNMEFADAQARAYTLGLTETTGISSLNISTADSQTYTLGGAKSNQLHKGVNIVRRNDGQVTKVLVK